MDTLSPQERKTMDTLSAIDTNHEELAKSLADQGVRYMLGSWVDILGRARAKATPLDTLPELLSGYARYTPRGICGIGTTNPVEEEVTSIPDPSTVTILPWDRRFAWMAADMWSDKGEPSELCPRSILKKQIDKAAAQGYAATLGLEPEFYVFRRESLEPGVDSLIPVSHAAYVQPSPAYDVETLLDSADFLETMVDYMSEIGLEVYGFGAEGGVGQYEIDFYYKSILDMADRMVLFRLMTHQVAKQHGLEASFMPKPYDNVWGSGNHFNMGLYSTTGEKKNVFRDGKEWSAECRAFTAGILKHSRALTALSNPLVNSYKRLVPRLPDGSVSWAPIKISYGHNNRSCMIRLPENRPCIENRTVDPAANPHLVGAFMLAAGMEGIRNNLDPGEPADTLTYSDDEIPTLPRTLIDAVEAFEKDPLVHEVFSPGFIRDYVDTKRGEWENSHLPVSQAERDRYLLTT